MTFVSKSLLYFLHLASLVVAPLPPPASPGTDACGPFDHAGDAGFSTCMASVVPGGSAPYGIVCGKDSSITIPIKSKSCATSAQLMCYTLAEGMLAAGEWHWTSDTAQTACRVGMFLSAAVGAAPLPDFKRCLNQIYQPMVFSCVNNKYNIATVNIKRLPDYTQNFTGQMVNAGYHAFVVSPTALFYDQGVTPGVFGSPVSGILELGNGTQADDLQAAQAASHGQTPNTAQS